MATHRKKKALVLLSGGLDSATTLAIARAEGFDTYALSFDYHQRHRIELESAKAVASAMNAARHLVVRFDLRDIGGSALTSELDVPKRGATPLKSGVADMTPPIPVTYVPARNTIFLSFALAWAEVLGTGDIFIGANAVDYSGYPDCRPEYLHAFEDMANLATKASVDGTLTFAVRAPLISMKKAAIIRKGRELGLDFALTWSCYDPQEDREASRVIRDGERALRPSLLASHGFKPCGLCDSCRLRAMGFREAGLEDPLVSLYDR
jgi:7-cyano-7-deazaguanine synthase